MNAMTLEEAKTILGEVATSMSDQEIEKLIMFIEKLCNKFIEEATKQ